MKTKEKQNMKKYISELLGTFILVFFGTGTAVISGLNPDNSVGTFGIAFAFGLTVIAAAYSIGDISGGHLNPAISFAMFLDKRIALKDFLLYTLFQIFGAILASSMIWIILNTLKGSVEFSYGANLPNNISNIGAFVVEAILTFVFVFVVLSVTKTKFIAPNLSVLVIGFALMMVHLIGIPLTGTSVNPARSIAPALFIGGEALSSIWIFITAPLLGAAISVAVHRLLEKQ
ncbi:MIP/aquaporin family protein [Staphylococcus simulans]|uniref:MIP/aquaporin family protein n=1 Tax=Staphylococcus simulans TaxID=1286 RepID=UPI002DBC2DF6|nr:aquaporin [Staphylococcus simulans]